MNSHARLSSRGAVNAGLILFLLGLLVTLVGVPALRADVAVPVRVNYTRLPARTVRPQVTNVRDLIRRIGPFNPGRGGEIPSHRLLRGGPRAQGGLQPSFSSESFNPQGPAPPVALDFDTIPDPQAEPPDGGIAVGPNHVVAAGNVSWGVYNKTTGQQLFIISFGAWYGALDTTNNIFDPRLDYDEETNRFYMSTVGLDRTNKVSTIQLSVSQTSDPLGNWNKYVFDAKELNPDSWSDFPTMGYNSEALFIVGNIFDFNDTFQHATLRILDKAKLLAGQPVTPTTLVTPGGLASFTISPAETHDPGNVEWMVETSPGIPAATDTLLRIWKVTNSLNPAPTITTTTIAVTPYLIPPLQDHSGSTRQVDGGDARTGAAPVLRGGQLWTTHGVGESIGGATRGVVRVYRIDVSGTPTVAQAFALSDPTLNLHFPSLEVDKFGAVLVGFTSSSSSTLPSMQYAVKAATDSAFSSLGTIKAGTVAYDRPAFLPPGVTRNRWGDYSDCAADPSQPNVIWHLGELAATTTTWVLHVGAVRSTPESLQVLFPNGGESLPVGQPVNITWQSAGFAAGHTVKIELSSDSGVTFPTVIAAAAPDAVGANSFTWIPSQPVGNQYRIRITSNVLSAISDTSDSSFQLVTGSIQVVTPNGGEKWHVGQTRDIEWRPTGFR